MQTITQQTRTIGPKFYTENGTNYRITATVRHDDNCKNGHNSFSVTASIDRESGNGRWVNDAGGCLHEEVAKHFPEIAHLIKWHLTSTDGPMHYLANTLYWLGWSGWTDGMKNSSPNLEYARSTAVWPDLPESYVCTMKKPFVGESKDEWNDARAKIENSLTARLDGLLAAFRADVEAFGFTF